MSSSKQQLIDYDKIVTETKQYIDLRLMPIINQIGEPIEGNLFMYDHNSGYVEMFNDKRHNLLTICSQPHVTQGMEIGFNAGFSAVMMLIANPNLKMTCFDLGNHKYAYPCYQQICQDFPNRVNLILGDSRLTVSSFIRKQQELEPNKRIKFDFIHIDGGHDDPVAESDILNSYQLASYRTILIMDDYNFHNLHNLWNSFVKKLHLQPVTYDDICNLRLTQFHDIKIKL